MPYQRGAPSLPEPSHEGEQVFNAHCRPIYDPTLTPVSNEAADQVKAGMAPLLAGQAVPKLGERVTPDECVRRTR